MSKEKTDKKPVVADQNKQKEQWFPNPMGLKIIENLNKQMTDVFAY